MSLPRKSVAAAVVLLVGLTAAWLFFRRGATEEEQVTSTTNDRLVIREPAASPWTKPAAPPELPWQKNLPSAQASQPAAAEPPQAYLEPPQPVSAAGNVAKEPSSDLASRFAQAFGSATPRVHRIVDGDTLGRLAERYLGNTQRQAEIFDANRDKLKDPDLLPIGVELRIPTDPPLKAVPAGALRSPNQ